MDIKNLKFAYTKYGLANINTASKEFNYFLDINLKIELIYCKGEKVKPYWRKKQNTDLNVLVGYFKGESLEHYNAKMNIVYSKKFEFKTENKEVENVLNFLGLPDKNRIKSETTIFQGFEAKAEYKCLIVNKIIDAVLLDENNLPIIGIEICNTNKKKYKDIIEFHKLNYPIYEYNINSKTSKVLHDGDNSIETIKLRERISKGRREIQKIRKRIDLLEKGFERLNKKVKKCWSDYYREEEEEPINIESIKQRIARIKYNIISENKNKLQFKEKIGFIEFKDELKNNKNTFTFPVENVNQNQYFLNIDF